MVFSSWFGEGGFGGVEGDEKVDCERRLRGVVEERLRREKLW